jgi:predicted GH43/DUF377 family glycosyl hydrolase
MIEIRDEGIVLERTDNEFENQAVINPACIKVGDITKIFYRAVKKGNGSTIGYAELKDGKIIERKNTPIIVPEFEYEKRGIEDPRVLFFEGKYYLFYTAYDGVSARGAFAESDDLVSFKKMGLITPSISYKEAIDLFKDSGVSKAYEEYGKHYIEVISPQVLLWEKDTFIFPRRINGKIAFVHRIMPGMQIAYVDSFHTLADGAFWKDHLHHLKEHVLLDPVSPFENHKIGGGCPPIETAEGWLIIYHGVEKTTTGLGRIYHAGAALLDLNDPQKILGRLKIPLFSPSFTWEVEGEEGNVVFPTSAVDEGNGRLSIYLGAADTRITRKSLDISELLNALKHS